MIKLDSKIAINDIAKEVSIKAVDKPIEVAKLLTFLGSDESSHLTGARIVSDAGSTILETMSISTKTIIITIEMIVFIIMFILFLFFLTCSSLTFLIIIY